MLLTTTGEATKEARMCVWAKAVLALVSPFPPHIPGCTTCANPSERNCISWPFFILFQLILEASWKLSQKVLIFHASLPRQSLCPSENTALTS